MKHVIETHKTGTGYTTRVNGVQLPGESRTRMEANERGVYYVRDHFGGGAPVITTCPQATCDFKGSGQ